MSRLFTALWPDEPLRQALRNWRDAGPGGVATRPVAPEQLHLTLHFLGVAPSEQVPALRSALRVPMRAFALGLSRCERWPGGVLVAPPDAVPAALTDLHAALGDALHRIGLACEARAFRPHVTLARRHTGPLPPAVAPALRWDVGAYVLVESGGRAGGGYTVVQTYA